MQLLQPGQISLSSLVVMLAAVANVVMDKFLCQSNEFNSQCNKFNCQSYDKVTSSIAKTCNELLSLQW